MKELNYNKVTFHIGLPKAASTWLQKEIFPNFKNINFSCLNSRLDYFIGKSNNQVNYLYSSEHLSGWPLL
jgi:hypothetical protein